MQGSREGDDGRRRRQSPVVGLFFHSIYCTRVSSLFLVSLDALMCVPSNLFLSYDIRDLESRFSRSKERGKKREAVAC